MSKAVPNPAGTSISIGLPTLTQGDGLGFAKLAAGTGATPTTINAQTETAPMTREIMAGRFVLISAPPTPGISWA